MPSSLLFLCFGFCKFFCEQEVAFHERESIVDGSPEENLLALSSSHLPVDSTLMNSEAVTHFHLQTHG